VWGRNLMLPMTLLILPILFILSNKAQPQCVTPTASSARSVGNPASRQAP
jgi:hypothetical protein